MGRFEGKTAVITGAASGIGAATAVRLAAEGATIAGLDIAEPKAEVWQPVEAEASKATFHVVDVTDEDAVARAIGEATAAHGALDVLVNAAGVAGGGPLHETDAWEWDRVIGVNLKGLFFCCKHAIREMLGRGGGAIVNVASIEGLIATESTGVYGASKGAVIQLTRNLAVDYTHLGIRTNSVCPGLVDTPMTEIVTRAEIPAFEALHQAFLENHLMRRAARPEEIASAIAFLASEDASFITGAALPVDGGWTAGRREGIEELLAS